MSSDSFTYTGNHKFDFCLINDSVNWAIIPANTIKGFSEDLPIRLQLGDRTFGKCHIEKRHKHWLSSIKHSVETALALKLSQSGTIFSTEEDNKIKIMMRVSPDSLIVLRYQPHHEGDFFTVVTMYYKNGRVDGEQLGRYVSSFKC